MLIELVVGGGVLYEAVRTYKAHRKRKRTAKFLQPKQIATNPIQRVVAIAASVNDAIEDKIGLKPISDKMKVTIQKFEQDKIAPLLGNVRYQQLEAISATNQVLLGDTEKDINRQIATFSVALGLGIAGVFVYPPLGLAGLLLTSVGVVKWYFKAAWKSLFEERKVRISVLDSILWAACLFTGRHILAAWACLIIGVSRKILIKTEDHSRKSLINVFGEQPRSVWMLFDGVEVETPFEELKIGDIVVINAGETIPIDGIITDGIASIDQHKLTGESQPMEIERGDEVFASTLVLSGRIHVQVEKTGKETAAAQIGEILSHTADFKATVQSRGEVIADKSALPTLMASGLTLPILGLNGAVGILNSNWGYNMRVLAPIGMLKFLNLTSQHGILIKDGRSLELLNQVDTVVFDKTGTLTQEKPYVGNIYTCDGSEEDEVLKYAAAAEYKQKHPIALAILFESRVRRLSVPEIDDAEYFVGYGLTVTLDDKCVRVGSSRFMDMEGISIPQYMQEIQECSHGQGHTLVMVAINDKLVGALEMRPTVRLEAKKVINGLRSRHIQSIYIISGDHEVPTRKLAEELGIDHYFANTLPEDKASLIEELQKEGKFVCYVGDGINDSIALKKANVSVSLRGASTIAIDTAQIVLMDESLIQFCQLLDIARSYDKTMKTTMFTTIVPGILCITGALLLHFGVAQSIFLNQTALAVGMTNLMLPAKSGQRNKVESRQ